MSGALFRPLLEGAPQRAELVEQTVGLHKQHYFDYTASGLAYEPIEARIREVLQTYANTHSKEAAMASLTGSYYEAARQNLAISLGLDEHFVILPAGCGSTKAIKRFQELLGLYIPPATRKRYGIEVDGSSLPLVVVGPYEHHSNEVSYREALCDTVRIGLTSEGLIDLEHLERVLEANKGREIIGSFCVASNVSGMITPYEAISTLLRRYGAVVCFDAAASSPYMNVPCELYDAMFLSPHKLLGGPGSCGLLLIRRSLIDATLPPSFAGGGTVSYVNATQQRYDSNVEAREDAGTPGILQLIRASLAYQLRNEIGFAWIKERKEGLLARLRSGLEAIEGCEIYGNADAPNIGIVSFNIAGRDPYELCRRLSAQFGVQTRAGCSCAGPYGHDLLGADSEEELGENPGWLRISVHFSQSEEEIDFLIESLKRSLGSSGGSDVPGEGSGLPLKEKTLGWKSWGRLRRLLSRVG